MLPSTAETFDEVSSDLDDPTRTEEDFNDKTGLGFKFKTWSICRQEQE